MLRFVHHVFALFYYTGFILKHFHVFGLFYYTGFITQAFEKKVKAQFSLVPFEEVTPVVEQVNLEDGDAIIADKEAKKNVNEEDKEVKKNGNNESEAKKNGNEEGKAKKNGKDDEKSEEAENWGSVHDTPVTDDMENDAEASNTDLDKTEPFKEAEKDEEKEKEKLKLKEKMDNERKRAEEKEKGDEEARKAEEIRKTEEKKEREEKRKAELREKEEKRKQEMKEQEEKRKQEEQEKAEKKKIADEKKKVEEKEKEEEKVVGIKRKLNPTAGPASKVKKVDQSKPDEYWKVLRCQFMVGESALTLEELIETDVIERGVLVFLLDISKPDEFFQEYFNKFENFESAERLLVGDRFSGVYLVTFEESESADDFVKLQRTLWDGTPLRKVSFYFCGI